MGKLKMTENQTTEIQQINIDEVLNSRNPKLKRVLPKFIINYIKHIAHQDDLNRYLKEHGHKKGRAFLEGMFEEFKIKTEVEGIENLPKDGNLIFAANHPLGGIDGAAFIYEIGRYYKDIKTITNDILQVIRNMDDIFVGVNSFGKNTREHLAGVDKMLNSDSQLLIFPSGLVSRRKNGVIMDFEWKKTFVDWARKYNRNIIPVHFSGRVSNFFYTFANIRTSLGIKSNIEMFYLVNEMFKHQGGTLKITIGKPIPYQMLDSSIKPAQWANLIRLHVYNLAENPKAEFKPSLI
jgi:putative hemolysin